MTVRIVTGLAFAACLFGGAEAQSVDDLTPAARTAFVDWNKCLAGHVQTGAVTNARPEDVTSTALKLCELEERAASEALGKDFGAEGRAGVVRYRSTFSTQAARAITERRAGDRPSDPLAAWGNCVGEETRKGVMQTQDAAAQIADKAMIACQAFEQAARRANASGNAEEDEKTFALGHKTLRDQSIESATSARASR